MKKIFLLVFIVSGSILYSQSNRVLNPSFENYIDTFYRGFPGYATFRQNLVNNWSDPNYSTSDLFTNRSLQDDATYPNIIGIQGFKYPRTGKAFAGLAVFSISTTSLREYIQASFIDSLVTNKIYAIKYYASLNNYARCLTDLGFYFSKNKIDTFDYFYFTKPNIIPQYENPNTNWINTFDGWQEMKGIYRASGGEKYTSIGNFTIDSLTNFDTCLGMINLTFDYSYLFIDDVSVYDTSIIDTIKLCSNDSTEINHQWYKPSPSIINEPFDSGVVVRHYIEALPNSTSYTEIDVPYHIGDTVKAGFLWVCHSTVSQTPSFVCDSFDTGMTGCYRYRYVWPTPDTFVDAYFQNIYGCDSTVRYHVRTNVGIDESGNLSSINIYPNPLSDYLYIDYDKNKKLFYTLYDLSGKLIFDKNILTQSIDVSILDKGMYILEIQDEEDNSVMKKIIKE